MKPSTSPKDSESCHRMRMDRMAETDHSLLVMLGNFLFNGKHISFGVVRNLNICGHRGGARPDRNILALFYKMCIRDRQFSEAVPARADPLTAKCPRGRFLT